MRSRNLLSILVIFFSTAVYAETTLIVIPRHTDVGALMAIKSHEAVTSFSSVFDKADVDALTSLGQASLAMAIKIDARDDKAVEDIKGFIKAKKFDVEIEENTVVLSLSEPFEEKQWALQNDGGKLKFPLDDITSTEVQGVRGEDIGLRSLEPTEGEQSQPEGKGIVVAVLDTGVDLEHPDLKKNIYRKDAECVALARYKECLLKSSKQTCDSTLGRVDADGNGYPLDCYGWNVTAGKNVVTGLYGDQETQDELGHGTHVSGIIAAAKNEIGVRGVAPNACILPVKVIKQSPNVPIRPQGMDLPPTDEKELRWSAGFADLIARGMLYAIRSGANVINMSLAWPPGVDSPLMRKMVELARSRGVLVVAAAGNDSADSRVLPCQYAGVICVGASGPNGALTYFSNFGSFVDVAAPGLSILSTWPMAKRPINFTVADGYDFKNGTSMASPMVAGVLARLLSDGFSPREAFARLYAGARSIPSEDTGVVFQKAVRSGNIDYSASKSALPQPLILQADKSVVQGVWNGGIGPSSAISISIALKNYWLSADAVRVNARLKQVFAGAELSTASFSFDTWNADEVKSIETTIIPLSKKIEGRLAVILNISLSNGKSRELIVPVDIARIITPSAEIEGTVSVPVVGEVAKGATLRSITRLDSTQGSDYLAQAVTAFGEKLQLLVDEGDQYRVAAEKDVDSENGDLVMLQRVDLNKDGNSEYFFVYKLPPPQGSQLPVLKFKVFDGSLSQLLTFEYDNKVSALPERFQWLDLQDSKMNAMAWVGIGPLPSSEKSKPTPWDKEPQETIESRFYYLTPDGLHTIKPPKGWFFVQTLNSTAYSREKLEVPVLLATGEDYKVQYATAVVSNGEVTRISPLDLKKYRMLYGLTDLSEVICLNGSDRSCGTSFNGRSNKGRLRSTMLVTGQKVVDRVLSPPAELDSIMQTSAIFSDFLSLRTFSQSHYFLQYNDWASGEVAVTSLDRFSFLPSLIFNKGFFPVVGEESRPEGKRRMPAVLISAASGVLESTEVVMPVYDHDSNQLLGLARPAQFRWISRQGCQTLGNPIPSSSELPDQLVFFCKDKFLRLPISY